MRIAPALAILLVGASLGRRVSADEPAPLTRAGVAAVVEAHSRSVSGCYRRALVTKPWLEGQLVMHFTIEATGSVGAVEIERTELYDVALLACVQDAIRAITFARAPGAPMSFAYPITFAGSRGDDPAVLVDGSARPATLPTRCALRAQCRQLGAILSHGVDADRPRALQYFLAGCKLGDGPSCAGAAAQLDYGRGFAKDKIRALAFYERACGLGHQPSCTTVAMAHALGLDGAAKDEARAAKLLERACAAGEGGACLNLSERLRFGLGVARDEARAAEIRRAANDERQRP